ncbi:siderophore-interacting protein [Acetobacter sp. DsW_063]|uniref:siderophore-interacting protein n=1 Tax=Acetobacter sp. DsW_063 TaxID=1514894 RepID=UPI001E5B1B4C|nr:siderophore-interacting protein [Acetobacter sp. DsW_063]
MNAPVRTPQRVRHDTRLRAAQVVSVTDISPKMRSIVFRSEDLKDFVSLAADDHVKLFFPPSGANPADRSWLQPGAGGRPSGLVARDYTPRRFDTREGTIDIEFVLHDHGPASSWASQAKVGQWLGIGGPRGSFVVPDDYGLFVLIGDETALPAIARRLEELPAGTNAIVLIEVADAREERVLPTAADARVTWLVRNGAAAGTTDLLIRAVEALQPPGMDAADIYVWIGAEIETARGLRAWFAEHWSMPRAQIRAGGYWRLGVADGAGRIDD